MTNLAVAADETTSKKMRAVRQAGTAPELAVRAALASLGLAFETNVRDKPGRPDVWLAERNIPIFVHGCFWHRHEGCPKASTPKKNREFWQAKFAANIARDERDARQLREMGCPPIVVWQCQTKDEDALAAALLDAIRESERPS